MQRRRKRIAMIAAIVLAALMLLPMIISGIASLIPEARGVVTQKDIDDLKKKKAEITENIKKIQGQIKDLKGQRAHVVESKLLYDEQLELIEQEKELIAEWITQLNVEISERQQELDEALAREAGLKERFVGRVQAMERMGDISYLSVLLRAESLTDLMTRWDAVREVMASDKKLADELIAVRLGIEDALLQLDGDKQEQYERRQELAEKEVEVAELSAEADDMMAAFAAEMALLMQDEKAAAEAGAAADKELKEYEAEWARIIEEQRRRNNSVYVGGAYLWPLPGHYNISSGFGMRKHPVYKVQRMHTGIDIPAPKGTPIVASNSGEIIIKTKSGGYGNYIVIDHGGGQATLYAHMSSFAKVNVGTKVKAGDTIGYVGSTGVSTGNHLHFEIIINGEPVNPDVPGRLKK